MDRRGRQVADLGDFAAAQNRKANVAAHQRRSGARLREIEDGLLRSEVEMLTSAFSRRVTSSYPKAVISEPHAASISAMELSGNFVLHPTDTAPRTNAISVR